MSRLIIVSNRLPVRIVKQGNKLSLEKSIGGLATGLDSLLANKESIWLGWSGIAADKIKGQKKRLVKKLKAESFHPVFLKKKEIDNYYYGFSNKTIWPLFHYFPQYAVYDRDFLKAYKKANQIFLKALLAVYKKGDIIWIHDYHLMLLPQLVRKKLPRAKIGFFLHIPFPSFEIYRLFPWRKTILRGLLGADLIGFHTYNYAKHFLTSLRYLLGHEHSFGDITVSNRLVKADTFPMGIDFDRFSQASSLSKVRREVKKVKKKTQDTKVILSVDRLDYTKGISHRLAAFDLFLDKHKKYREKVTLILVGVPSRTKVERYYELKKEVDELIGAINGKYGTIGWTPVWYLSRSLPFEKLASLYIASDIALLTPIRDGLNLIAKEFIASKNDEKGVLILSEMAGASEELGEALIVNPNNKERVTDAIEKAFNMTPSEQKRRNRVMRKRLKRYDVKRWANDFIDRLNYVKKQQKKLYGKRLSGKQKSKLASDFSKSKSRLFLLDYDGTIVPIQKEPKKAKPDKKLLSLLGKYARKKNNELVIISGRDKKTLSAWFKKLNIGLIAEHGAFAKQREKPWETIDALDNQWKEDVRPVLEVYVDRTPGSFVEEKKHSLVWHYRNADPVLVNVRVNELKDVLLRLTENINIGVLKGRKMIEIQDVSINKGRAALQWIEAKKWGFILAVGDDLTDENMFSVLPEYAYSIKVGFRPSEAKYTSASVSETRRLLEDLIMAD